MMGYEVNKNLCRAAAWLTTTEDYRHVHGIFRLRTQADHVLRTGYRPLAHTAVVAMVHGALWFDLFPVWRRARCPEASEFAGWVRTVDGARIARLFGPLQEALEAWGGEDADGCPPKLVTVVTDVAGAALAAEISSMGSI